MKTGRSRWFWRYGAMFVAWFDMISTLFALTYIIIGAVLAHQKIQELLEKERNSKYSYYIEGFEHKQQDALFRVWLSFVAAVLLSCLLFWAAFKLLRATKEIELDPGKDAIAAAGAAQARVILVWKWIVVSKVYLALSFIRFIFEKRMVESVEMWIYISIRFIFSFIVLGFMKELKKCVAAETEVAIKIGENINNRFKSNENKETYFKSAQFSAI